MKLDSTIRDLQKEKSELEAKLKQVNVALSALAKLTPKASESPESKTENPAIRPAPQATATKPAPVPQPANKPTGL